MVVVHLGTAYCPAAVSATYCSENVPMFREEIGWGVERKTTRESMELGCSAQQR